jgi:adenylate cyclase
VLPFKNMSGDPEQEYFSDGITEDLITDLSKIPRLSVTSQNTAFTYKGRAVNVQQVGRELGVSHVLEGSVRKAGNRVRITAQLIDAKTDTHLWSERYDRELADIFEVQDELTRNIVNSLEVSLVWGESVRSWHRTSQSTEAYNLYLRALYEWQSSFNREGNARAKRMLEDAVALDPGSAQPYAFLGFMHLQSVRFGWSDSPEEHLEQGLAAAKKSLSLDETLGFAHSVIGFYHLSKREHTLALAEAQRGTDKNPEAFHPLMFLGLMQLYSGQPAQCIESLRKAMKLSPLYPAFVPGLLGRAYLLLGRYEEAVAGLEEFREGSPDSVLPRVYLAGTYAALGRGGDAAAEVREVLRFRPDFSLTEWLTKSEPYVEGDLHRMMELLRKAGLPE